MKKIIPTLLISAVLILSAWKLIDDNKPIVWKLNNKNLIGEYKPEVLGNPQTKVEGRYSSIYFNGINDGLVIPKIPIEGWRKFTIEVLFKPDGDGPHEPRFIHFEDTAKNRGTIELRLTQDGYWYLDAFLKNGNTNKGLALIDSTILHPTDKWYWAAMTYDGKKMMSYVNGKKELESEFVMPLFTKGKISLGVRLNKVNWFKGQIKEVRFHNENLDAAQLQHF